MAFTAFVSAGITGWEVDYALKTFRYASGSRMTVQALYSGLMNEVDDSAQMDDSIPMTAQTPTEFTLTNGWHIPESSMQYLKGGSIQTYGYDSTVATNSDGSARNDPIHVITMTGWTTPPTTTDIGKTVTGATAGTGVLLSYDIPTKKMWVRVAQSYAVGTWSGNINVTGGTAVAGTAPTAVTGEDVWANFYTLGTYTTQVMYIYQAGSLVLPYTGYVNGDLDQLIKVRASGGLVDSGNVTIFCRDLTYTFDNFTATASASGGRNPVPISVGSDSNDSGAGVTGVTVVVGAAVADVDGNGTNENYDITVDGGGKSCLEVYRYLKQITKRTAAAGGTFTTVSPNTGAGTAFFYRYANASYTETKQAPFATFAGGKILGARGVLIINVSDGNNRILIDQSGTTRTPPTSVTVTMAGVVAGDSILVARSTGSGSKTVDKNQLTIATATSGASTFTVTQDLTLPAYSDIPLTGVVRLGSDRYTYSGLNRATKTFTLGAAPGHPTSGPGTLSTTYTGGCWIPLIDDVATGTSFSATPIIYYANLNVVYRVRHYAAGAGNSILEFQNAGSVSNADISFNAVRTVDLVAT